MTGRKCQKPSRDEWAALNAEERLSYHRLQMLARRGEQLARVPNSAPLARTASDDAGYRKSIWPASKIARRAAR